MNQLTISGNFVADAEKKENTKDTLVVTARIAYNHGKDSEAEFFNVTAFGKTAERLLAQGQKGKYAVINGRIRERRWETEGEKRNAVDIVAQSVYVTERYEPTTSTQHETSEAGGETPEASGDQDKEGALTF